MLFIISIFALVHIKSYRIRWKLILHYNFIIRIFNFNHSELFLFIFSSRNPETENNSPSLIDRVKTLEILCIHNLLQNDIGLLLIKAQ